MSGPEQLAAVPQIQRVIDSRIAIDAPNKVLAFDSPTSVSYVQYQTQGNDNTMTPAFYIVPGSPGSGINRLMNLHVTGQVTITGTGFTIAGTKIALRAWPLHRIMQNIVLSYLGLPHLRWLGLISMSHLRSSHSSK